MKNILKKNPHYAYLYATDVIKGRWTEAEEYIKKDPYYAFYYAEKIIKDKNFWEKREEEINSELILNDPLKLINDTKAV